VLPAVSVTFGCSHGRDAYPAHQLPDTTLGPSLALAQGADGDAGLRASEGAGSGAGAVAARAGHHGDACGERRSRSRARPLTGAAVAAWPAVALVGSYELLMVIIRSAQAPEGTVPGREHPAFLVMTCSRRRLLRSSRVR
jgi:hypothetical protein